MRPKAVNSRVVQMICIALTSLCLTWGAAELGVRWLLFGEGSLSAAMGSSLRDPNRFADALSDDDFWKLQRSFQGVHERDQFERADAVHGWLPARARAEDLSHRSEAGLRGRRPVLLYGDSFSECVVPAEDCWESLLDESPLSEELCMLNYGTCAYGLDQIVLLLERSVDRYLEQDPIIVIGILVDEDLDRCALSFRGHPKPRAVESSDGFAWELPGEVTAGEWLESHPVEIDSYLARLITSSGSFPLSSIRESKSAMIAKKQRAATWLLQRLQLLLKERELEHFVVLFHGERLANARKVRDWREVFLVRTLEELEIPYVSSREALFADHVATGRVASDYFLKEGSFSGHYTATGNEAVFPAMLDGLRGKYQRAMKVGDAQASR